MQSDGTPNLVSCGSHAEAATLDVIFVHGLTGNSYNTWASDNAKDDTYWPEKLAGEMEGKANIWSLNYDAPLFKLSEGGKLDQTLGDSATSLLNHFAAKELGRKPIVFVTHSLGGLVVKALLRRAEDHDQWKSVAAMTRAVVFLGTPHCGSSLVRLKLLPHLIGKASAMGAAKGIAVWMKIGMVAKMATIGLPFLITWLVRPGQYVNQLTADSPYLRELADSYRKFAERRDVITLAFYELKRLFIVGLVVTPCSADPGIPKCTLSGVPANHFGICKPFHPIEQWTLYKNVKQLIMDVYKATGAGKTSAVFESHLEGKLKDLLYEPELGHLKDSLQVSGGKISIPKKFQDIPATGNLRVSFEEMLRDRLRKIIEKRELVLSETQIKLAEGSVYDLDKFVLYLWREHNMDMQMRTMRHSIMEEAKKIKNAAEGNAETPSLIPLFRAARGIERAFEFELPELIRWIDNSRQYVLQASDKFSNFDENQQTRNLLERLSKALNAFQRAEQLFKDEQKQKGEVDY